MRIAIAGATGMVGRELVAIARDTGHDVVELSRSHGTDLVEGTGIGRALEGVSTVVDVTNSPTQEEAGATAFFQAVAGNVGRAASRAGVTRTVVLSIIGVDRTPEDGYFVAKLAHERATAEHAPGPCILRAAQFHELAGQMLGWTRDGDTCAVPDMDVQPVAMSVVAETLLELATAAEAPSLMELAGPRRERLADMAARLVAHRGDPLAVTAAGVSDAVRHGAVLPGPTARIAGPDFEAWLATVGSHAPSGARA